MRVKTVMISKVFAKDAEFEADTSVEEDNIVISPRPAPAFTFEQLLAGIMDENIHEEVTTGPAVGNEVW